MYTPLCALVRRCVLAADVLVLDVRPLVVACPLVPVVPDDDMPDVPALPGSVVVLLVDVDFFERDELADVEALLFNAWSTMLSMSSR